MKKKKTEVNQEQLEYLSGQTAASGRSGQIAASWPEKYQLFKVRFKRTLWALSPATSTALKFLEDPIYAPPKR